MAASSRPIFLSYASQDAGAARRIAEALGNAGVEVWFDKSELRGGDAWDASIRKRIKGCALFMPVISATTNSRSEGYFRLEWKLAVERSHLMAEDQAFFVPVVIDDVGDVDARVPDAFRSRQWTHLPRGETPPAFVERVKNLLRESPEPEPVPPRSSSPSMAAVTSPPKRRARWIFATAGVIVMLGAAGLAAWQPWRAPAPSGPATVAPSAEGESIAVLSFANLSPDKDNEFFAEGIADEIISVLSRIPGLRVSARSASFAFKGKDVASKEIARQLGVNYLVEGSVRRSGAKARISVQVTKGADGFQVWANTYNKEIKDIFSVQDEIATSVAGALQLRFGTSVGTSAAAGKTRNPAAYEAFLRGRETWYSHRVDEAQRLLEEAVKLDPGFAVAYGALAELFVHKARERRASRDALYARAKAVAEKALSLDKSVVQAHNTLAEYAFHYAWEWDESDRHMQRALAVDPNYFLALSHYGGHEMARNRPEAALGAYLKVKSLNPLSGSVNIVMTLSALDRNGEAIQVARQDLAEHPDRIGVRMALGQALFLDGQREEGLRMLEDVAARAKDEISVQASAGWAFGRAGQKDKALAALRRVVALADGGREDGLMAQAMIHAGLDDRDRAMALLERAYSVREPSMPFVASSVEFRHLHADPRFRDLLRKMKLDVYFPATPAK
jgi:TolB-like protein/Flp pilus assembly protein TadD